MADSVAEVAVSLLGDGAGAVGHCLPTTVAVGDEDEDAVSGRSPDPREGGGLGVFGWDIEGPLGVGGGGVRDEYVSTPYSSRSKRSRRECAARAQKREKVDSHKVFSREG